jgi:hypothetical protein
VLLFTQASQTHRNLREIAVGIDKNRLEIKQSLPTLTPESEICTVTESNCPSMVDKNGVNNYNLPLSTDKIKDPNRQSNFPMWIGGIGLSIILLIAGINRYLLPHLGNNLVSKDSLDDIKES